MPALFVDTGAFYASADVADRHHESAARLFATRGVAGDLITTDYVFVETWCLVRARLGRLAALQYWGAMRRGVVEVIGVRGTDLARAHDVVIHWKDQDFSLVDATSFAVMERRGIVQAFAFDSHFRVYRYGKRRERSFHVLPEC